MSEREPRFWANSILQPTPDGTKCCLCRRRVSTNGLHLLKRAGSAPVTDTPMRAHIKCVKDLKESPRFGIEVTLPASQGGEG